MKYSMMVCVFVIMMVMPSCLLATESIVSEFVDEFWFEEAAYGNGRWVVVGGSGIRYSFDALAWNWVEDANTFADRYKGVTFADGFFVAAGYGRSLDFDGIEGEGTIAFSSDGVDWMTTPKPNLGNPENADSTGRHDKIAFNNGHWVAVGSNVIHSSNLLDWTEVLMDGGVALASGNGIFVFISFDGQIYTSPDGIDWTDHGKDPRFANSINGFSITYGNGLFVAGGDRDLTGENGSNQGHVASIFTSQNGIDWIERSQPTDIIFGVTYGEGEFVAVGNNGIVSQSTDGITWTESRWIDRGFENAQLDQVTYGDGIFLGVGGLSRTGSFQNGVMVAIKGLSVVPDHTTDLLGYLQFEGNALDSTGQQDPMVLVNAPIVNNALYLTGHYENRGVGGFKASWPVSELSKDDFSFALHFFPLYEQAFRNILTGGRSYRWISLRTNPSGELQLTLNNQNIAHTFTGLTVTKCDWHLAVVSVDVASKTIRVMFDGEILEPIILAEDFAWNTQATGRADFDFSNYSNGSSFYGYADNLALYNHALSEAEMLSIAIDNSFSSSIAYAEPQLQSCEDPDLDKDGLTDREEDQYGTHAFLADTDGDGLSDYDEIAIYHTDPLWADGDGDGLLDPAEIAQGTDAGSVDSDGDGLWDGFEVSYGFSPLTVNDNGQDTDLDGIPDIDEQRYGTDPRNPDSDEDGVDDGDEVDVGSDPTVSAMFLPAAYYQFEGVASDSMGNSPDFELRNTYYHDGSLYLNGTYEYTGRDHWGYSAGVRPKDFSPDAFSICFDFYRLPSEDWDNRAILHMRPWFEVRDRNGVGSLQLTLRGVESDYFSLPLFQIEDCGWHNMIFTVNLLEKRIAIYLNGELVRISTLPDWFEPDTEFWTNDITFLDYASGGAFYGYVDNFIVFNTAISPWLAHRIGTGVADIAERPYIPPTEKDCTHPDSDGDGLTDYDEFSIYNTSPNNVDTDGGGTIDSVEIANGTDPLDSSDD